jgi:hypothetical protein
MRRAVGCRVGPMERRVRMDRVGMGRRRREEEEEEEEEEKEARHRRVVKARAKPEEVVEIPRPAITRETSDEQSPGGGGRERISQGGCTHWQAQVRGVS